MITNNSDNITNKARNRTQKHKSTNKHKNTVLKKNKIEHTKNTQIS